MNATFEIDRLTATAHLPQDVGDAAVRVRRLLRATADGRLDAELRTVPVPAGIWCLRRVEATVRFDLERGDPALAQTWAAAMSRAVARALAAGGPDVVRYRDEADALADLVRALAAGRTALVWAWRAIGLLEAEDPDPAVHAGQAMLAALGRRPWLALGAVLSTVNADGLASLDHVLGSTGWTRVASLADEASFGHGGHPAPPRGHAAPEELTEPTAGAAIRSGTPSSPGDALQVRALAERLVLGSRFAAAVRATRVRPDPPTLLVWARLVVSEVDATALRGPRAGAVLAEVAEMLGGRAAARTVPRPVPDTSAVVRPPVPASAAAPTGADVRATAAAPQPHLADRTHRTDWSGLLFLLATAAEAGLPSVVTDDPHLACRPLPWVLQHVARQVGTPSADPAVAAFAGRDPGQPDPWRHDHPTTVETGSVVALADRWAEVTLAALGVTSADAGALLVVMRRPGTIRWSPGWIELTMPLDTVDLGIRRAGLDLDPGWVPWLGAVVRYVYD